MNPTLVLTSVALVLAVLALAGLLAVPRMLRVLQQAHLQSRRAESLFEELEAKRAELEQSRREHEESLRLRSAFFATLSHELRTPLNSILGLTELLSDGSAGPVGEQQRQYLAVVRRSGQTLLRLIDDVLELSHLEAGHAEVEVVPTEIEAPVRSVVDALRPLAADKGLALSAQLPGDLPRVMADEERLRQVLVTLVSNAIKFTARGSVAVQADVVAQRVVLRVVDTGTGLSPEARRQILSRLEQGDGLPSGVDGSTGLGLAVARKLVKLIGGQMMVESESGRGSAFCVALPVASPGASAAPSARLAPVQDSGGRRILVIEDDEIERNRVRGFLDAAGFVVAAVGTGREGLDALRSSRFDALVLDLVMPEMSGLDVLKALSDPALPRVPVVVLSAMFMTRSEREILGPDVSAVVQKGDMTRADLIMALRRTLSPALTSGTPEPRRPTVLAVEDDPDNLFTLRKVLADLPIRLETAGTAGEALAACQRLPPDLVIMDLKLPGMSGLDAVRAVRATPGCEHTPVVALTAAATRVERSRIRQAAFDDSLIKPIRPRDLVRVVSRFLHLDARPFAEA